MSCKGTEDKDLVKIKSNCGVIMIGVIGPSNV